MDGFSQCLFKKCSIPTVSFQPVQGGVLNCSLHRWYTILDVFSKTRMLPCHMAVESAFQQKQEDTTIIVWEYKSIFDFRLEMFIYQIVHRGHQLVYKESNNQDLLWQFQEESVLQYKCSVNVHCCAQSHAGLPLPVSMVHCRLLTMPLIRSGDTLQYEPIFYLKCMLSVEIR